MTEPFSIAALATAFAAGLISVLSPCVLPLMPAYLSLISGVSLEEMRRSPEGEGDGDADPEATRAARRRVFRACLGFVAGFSAVFVLLGATAFSLGRAAQTLRGDIGGIPITPLQIAGVLLVLMGFHMLGWLRIPFLGREARFQGPAAPRGPLGTFLFGAAFAFGWSPCVGPILGGILTLAAGRDTAAQGVLLLTAYSAGLALPFLLAGWSVELFFSGFARLRPHMRRVEMAAGVLLVATGIVIATGGFDYLAGEFSFLAEWIADAEQNLL